jgi:hypothetical protein
MLRGHADKWRNVGPEGEEHRRNLEKLIVIATRDRIACTFIPKDRVMLLCVSRITRSFFAISILVTPCSRAFVKNTRPRTIIVAYTLQKSIVFKGTSLHQIKSFLPEQPVQALDEGSGL